MFLVLQEHHEYAAAIRFYPGLPQNADSACFVCAVSQHMG
jgi:hypothetical protein